jgi:hypothetical protein
LCFAASFLPVDEKKNHMETKNLLCNYLGIFNLPLIKITNCGKFYE